MRLAGARWAAVAAVTVAALSATASAWADASPLNVVVIETDDQTADSLWAMPIVDRLLVRRGVTFENSFVSFPLCCPSRATFLTGQYPHNHGVENNRPPQGGYEKLRGDETLPVWLHRAGYRTMLVGKYLNGYGMRDPHEIPPGWTDWHGLVDPKTYYYYGFTINDEGHTRAYAKKPANYQTDVLTGKAVRLLRSAASGERPFFLWTTYLAPHFDFSSNARPPTPVPGPKDLGSFAGQPAPRTPSFDEADVSDKPATIRQFRPLTERQRAGIRRLYQRELESLQAVDRGVGELIDTLRDTGELDSTLLVFTSDNGYLHGEHRVPLGKWLPYEPSIRVPLVIRGPGVPAGVRLGDLVSNQDLSPTILDAAGASAALPQDGVSLMPLLRGGALPARDLLIEGRYPFGSEPVRYAGVRTKRWFYAEYTNGERELYDLGVDWDELSNVAGSPDYASVESDLASRLSALRTCSGASCVGPPPPRASAAR